MKMKKFLSALTAFCMGTSMIASALPATALTTAMPNTEKAQAGDFTWSLNNAVMDDDRYVYVEAFVANDPGTNGFTVSVEVQNASGKWVTLKDFGLVYSDSSNGGAYPGMGAFFYNQDNSSVASANMASVDPQYAVENKAVFSIELEVPASIADGVYKTRINPNTAKVAIGNTLLDPTYVTGSLVIGDDVTPPSDDPTDDPVVTPTTGHTWTMNKAATDSDRYAYIEAFVANDPGTNGFTVALEIQNASGKWVSLEEFGLEYSDSSNGGAYPGMGAFFYNQENSSVASANMASVEPQYAVDGKPVFSIEVFVPETIADGVYKTRINPDTAKVAIGNTLLNPTYVTGTLTVGEVEEHIWDLNDAETDADGYATIEAYVTGDPGTNGFETGILIQNADGKWVTPAEFGLVWSDGADGGAYPRMDAFFFNSDKATVAAANNKDTDPQYADPNKPVFSMEFQVPSTIAPGTYKVKFVPETEVGSADGKTVLEPTLKEGTLTISGSAPAPIETTTKEIDAEWIIGTVEAAPGETVTVPVTVKGDVDGINSYIADLGQDAGPVATEATAGDAYASLDFAANMDTLAFGGTNYSIGKNVVAADGAVVFNVTFTVPADASGIYNIKFEDLTLYDVDMTQLIPKKTDGWIKVTTPDPTASSSEIDAEWIIGTVEAAPGETVTVPVTVKGDKEGLNSYIADLGQDAGPTANGAAAGDAYAGLGFEANTADLKFGGTNYSSNTNVVAADNATVFEVTFVVPENAAAGTIYNITFEDLEIYNYDMVQLIPKKTNGWIKIKDTEFVEESSKIDAEWIIGTVEAEPGETVTVPVTVKGDKDGLNSYIADLGQDAGPTAGDATAGDAYAALDFVGNTANLTYGATNYTLGANVVAADGAVVFNVPFTVPADAAPGTVYNITFEDLAIYNIDMVRLIPTQTNGWIKVKDDEPTTTEDPGEWIIGTVEAEPGETVTVPVTVKGDKNGLNSYIADLGQDAGPTANGAAAGDAYAGLGFEANTADLKFGGTNYTTGANVVPADGAVVFNITFKVPDDAAPGTVYDIFFENLEVIDSNMSSLTPKKTDGWIKIKDVTEETTTTTSTSETSETTTTTSAPDTSDTTTTTSAPDTSVTTTTTTESDVADTTTSSTREQGGSTVQTTTTEPIVPNEAGEWIIGTTEVEAGATVTIPVIVKGDKNGINSYIFDMGQDAGPVANAATAGDAYAALDFAFNLDNLTFGATNYTLGENVVAADGAVVLNVTFTVPADAAPGTIYNLTFEGLTVYDINMNELTPGQTPGWIKIIDSDETTTTAATTTTASETDDTTATTATTVPPAVVSTATTATTASETGDTTATTATTASETGDTTATTATTASETDDTTATTATTASETGDTTATTATTTSETGDTTTTTSGTNEVDNGGTTTTPATGESSSSSSETTTTSGDTPVEPANPGEWIIGTVEAKPGETVTVPVIVKGDKTGINSYIFDMGQDEGPVANGATAGDAYAALDFASNLDTLTFGGTNYTLGENIVAPDGSVVLNVTFTVPENAEPGTVYDLFFDSLKVFDIGMNELTPGQTPGWIKIIPSDATTTETTATTASETGDTTATTATTASETGDTTATTATTASETGDTTATTATTASETGDTTATTATTASETGETTTTTESETSATTTTTESETSATTTTESETTETTATTASETDEATTTTESETSATTTTESETSATTTTESETSATTTTESETSATTTTESETSATTTTESETTATTTTTESETTETTTTTDTKTVTGYEYEVVGKTKFYLSHDMRPFDPADLVASVVEYELYSDGTKSEGVTMPIASVTFDVEGWTNPEEVFKGQVLGEDGKPKSDYDVYYKGTIPATITDPMGVEHDIAAVGTAYIAVKGDATLTGEADAKDAAIVLMYAAKVGADMPAYIYSETDAELEAFAYFLTDVTGESEDNGATDSLGNAKSDCDAKDAAKILVYAAIEGSGKYADWAEVLSAPLPKYTAAIDAYKKANGWVRPE